MHAHSQFCMSGDHTLEATRFAIKVCHNLSSNSSSNPTFYRTSSSMKLMNILLLFSVMLIFSVMGFNLLVLLMPYNQMKKSNLSPFLLDLQVTKLKGKINFVRFLRCNRCLFLRLKRSLPSGKSFVCLDTKDIPQIMQQIFTSTIIH